MLMRAIVMAACCMILAGLLIQSPALDMLIRLAVPEADETAVAQTPTAPPGKVVLPVDGSGHFFADGAVSGRPVRFMIDTGASAVVLTAETANRLNLSPSPSDFTGLSQTANGSVPFAPVRLDEVRIGSIRLRDVQAVVLPKGALDTNLLGMTFLSRLRSFQSTGEQMVLAP